MNWGDDLVDAMFHKHGVAGPWRRLPSTGLANDIYATRDVVLRVATDHPEGVSDARTESVAAPVACSAGILTPHLVAFDDSRTLVDRPFSLWERVHGETLGLASLNRQQTADAWREVGRELARLHHRVTHCADPDGYLDQPSRELDLGAILKPLVDAGRIAAGTVQAVEQLVCDIRDDVSADMDRRFVHHDVHPMNVMCSTSGRLLAIIDWGDAGWGDPTLDFAAIPLEAMPFAVQGYESEAPGALGDYPGARFIWDKVLGALEDLWDNPNTPIPVEAWSRYLR